MWGIKRTVSGAAGRAALSILIAAAIVAVIACVSATAQVSGGISRWDHGHASWNHTGPVFTDQDITVLPPLSTSTIHILLEAYTGDIYASGTIYGAFSGATATVTNIFASDTYVPQGSCHYLNYSTDTVRLCYDGTDIYLEGDSVKVDALHSVGNVSASGTFYGDGSGLTGVLHATPTLDETITEGASTTQDVTLGGDVAFNRLVDIGSSTSTINALDIGGGFGATGCSFNIAGDIYCDGTVFSMTNATATFSNVTVSGTLGIDLDDQFCVDGATQSLCWFAESIQPTRLKFRGAMYSYQNISTEPMLYLRNDGANDTMQVINGSGSDAIEVNNNSSGRALRASAVSNEAIRASTSGNGTGIYVQTNATTANNFGINAIAANVGFTSYVTKSYVSNQYSTGHHAYYATNIAGTEKPVALINRWGSACFGNQCTTGKLGNSASATTDISLYTIGSLGAGGDLYASGTSYLTGNVRATASLYVTDSIISEDEIVVGGDRGEGTTIGWLDDAYNAHFVNDQNTGRGVKVINTYNGTNAPASIKLHKFKLSGGTPQDGAANDQIGTFSFNGPDDGTPNTDKNYAQITVDIDDPTSGSIDGRMEFSIAENDSLTEYLEFDGTDGAINASKVIVANAGVDFGTSTKTHHEEGGLFTPVYYGSTNEGSEACTYTAQAGVFSRIGDQLHIDATIGISSCSTPPTGAARIKGLPYAANSTSGYLASCTIGYLSNYTLTASNIMTATVGASQDYIVLWQTPVGGGAATNAAIDTAHDIRVSCDILTD